MPSGTDAARGKATLIFLITALERGLAVFAPMVQDALADAFLIFPGYLFLGHGSLLMVSVYAPTGYR